jgi:DNA-binding NtrC family response regulator
MTIGTFEERGAGPRSASLICVLGYDDLARDRSTAWLIEPRSDLTIVRARGASSVERVGGELRVPDDWLSGRHATLRLAADGTARVVDPGSKNGTFVNGARVSERELADGDLLEVGHSLFVFRLSRDRARSSRIGATPSLSPEIAAIEERLPVLAKGRDPLLIIGETGTGKHDIARAIAGGEPPTFDGSALDKEALATIEASRGPVLVDEVGHLPAAAQAGLLSILDPRAGRAVRVIATTNRELLGAPEFRADLLHRLSSSLIRVPPLRKRREDLGILIAHFLREAGISGASITVSAARQLFLDAMPGNLRQLRASIVHAARAARGGAIDVADLPQLAAVAPSPPPVPPSSEAPRPRTPLEREGDHFRARHAGQEFLLADSSGLRFIAFLLEHAGREFHVLDLMSAVRGLGSAGAPAGDAGPALDPAAKAAYRARIEELRAELAEAVEWADEGRAERARREMEAIAEELARGVGLGGRDRKAASAAERARVNITQQIKRALKRIEEQSPALAHELSACLKTGTFCSYLPGPGPGPGPGRINDASR